MNKRQKFSPRTDCKILNGQSTDTHDTHIDTRIYEYRYKMSNEREG